MKNYILKISFVIVILFIADIASATECNFYRNLGLGSRGSDVVCLQQYLRNSGYGYISPDGVYGPMTMQAVMSWQNQNDIYPVSGYFDNASRTLFSGTTWTTYNNGYGSVLGTSTDIPSYSLYSNEERAKMMIEDAIDTIKEAKDEIDDSNKNTNESEDLLNNAEDDLFDAIRAFIFDRDFENAYDFAKNSLENSEDAIDEIDGDSDKDQAEDAIDEADDAINDAEDAINEARDDGFFVGTAENLLDDAEDLLDESEEEFDNGDYDNAEDLADEARDLAEKALELVN